MGIRDEPVLESNREGTISFLMDNGPDTRCCALFINLGDNKMFDHMGYTPFGEVVLGLDVVKQTYAGYVDPPSIERIKTEGLRYLQDHFSLLSYVVKTDVNNIKPLKEDSYTTF